MAKKVKFDADARAAMLKGVDIRIFISAMKNTLILDTHNLRTLCIVVYSY